MSSSPFAPRGSIAALVTPFAADGGIDIPAFAAQVSWHRAAGSAGVVVGGSTGESGALESHEFDALLDVALLRAGDGLAVIAGVGAPATHKALALAARARGAGAHALLAVTPYYARPTQDGLRRHYEVLSGQSGLPLILYNVPGRTGVDLLPETVVRLIADPRIVGIKEARPEPERMAALLALKRPGFAVLSGDDPTACRALLAGADGVISVAANLVPVEFAALVEAALRDDADTAQRHDAGLAPLYALLALESNPIPLKWLMARAGRIEAHLRLPLVPLSAAHHAAAEAEYQRLIAQGALASP